MTNDESISRSQAEAIIAKEIKRERDLSEKQLSEVVNRMSDDYLVLKAENAALTARVKELEGEVVFGFYEEEFPMYAQGYQGAGGCELCDPITAEEANGLVTKIKALETQLATTRKALEFYGDVHKYPAPLTGGMGDLWRDCGEIARNALTETFMPTHTHLKRGSSYSYFGTGTFQTDSWVYPHRYVDMGEDEEDMLSCDMQQVAVYLEDDGKIWVRPVGEFNDGRFAKV